jgi:hypothetical protein
MNKDDFIAHCEFWHNKCQCATWHDCDRNCPFVGWINIWTYQKNFKEEYGIDLTFHEVKSLIYGGKDGI